MFNDSRLSGHHDLYSSTSLWTSQWQMVIFDPPQLRDPLTEFYEVAVTWLVQKVKVKGHKIT